MVHILFENILTKKKKNKYIFRDSTRFDYLLKSLELINKPYTELEQKELEEQQLEVIILSSFFFLFYINQDNNYKFIFQVTIQ